jgi:hypothetical protein
MMLALAALLDVGNETSIPSDKIRDWYWNSIRFQTYAQGANTRVVSDVDALAKGERLEFSLSEFEEETAPALLEPIRRNKILVNGIGAAFSARGARDVVTGELLASAQSGPIVARSLVSLAKGIAKPDETAIVGSVVYAREQSFYEAAAAMRSGEAFERVYNWAALTSQFVDRAAIYGDFASRNARLESLLREGI